MLLVAAAGVLDAQAIDASRSRFLSTPHGRTGCYAPYRLAVRHLGSTETLVVRSEAPGVVLTTEVAVAGKEAVDVVLPVYVGEGARVMVHGKGDPFTPGISPDLPTRRVEADFARPYTAVFSTDPVYARGLLPSTPDGAICDYYELDEFFTDWRLFDGYDAIVVLNPAEVRLPDGAQRAMAEFCSLGGCALVAGSFRFGEKAVDLPAPAEPEVQTHRGVTVQRFGYGAGAIYRANADDLRAGASSTDVIVDALRDQLWYGADRAPGGKPVSRAAPVRPPMAAPLPPENVTPRPLFWGLAGGLLVLCGVAPAVMSRVTRRLLPAHAAVLAGALLISLAGAWQERPLPALETSTLMMSGEGEAVSTRTFLHANGLWQSRIEVDLAGTDRLLYRACPAIPGWRAWVQDWPLAPHSADRGAAVKSQGGMVGKVTFRDFATEAHRGNTSFSTDDAWLLAWWLEESAFRGRAAKLAPMQAEEGHWPGARTVKRGAIRVTALRVPG